MISIDPKQTKNVPSKTDGILRIQATKSFPPGRRRQLAGSLSTRLFSNLERKRSSGKTEPFCLSPIVTARDTADSYRDSGFSGLWMAFSSCCFLLRNCASTSFPAFHRDVRELVRLPACPCAYGFGLRLLRL